MENKKSIITESKKSIYKFSMVLNGILLVALAYTYYSRVPERAAYSREADGGVPSPCPSASNDCSCICTDYSGSEPFHFIDGRLLREMATAFHETRSRSEDPNDAGSVWFALDTLKRFIWEIENRACNCQEVSYLGVRIYYARYPDPMDHSRFPDLDGVKDEYVLKHTVFMVPTFNKRGGDPDTHFDFDLSNTPFCPPNIIDSTDTVIVGLMGGRNHGTLCPPICGVEVDGTDGVAFGH